MVVSVLPFMWAVLERHRFANRSDLAFVEFAIQCLRRALRLECLDVNLFILFVAHGVVLHMPSYFNDRRVKKLHAAIVTVMVL